MKSPVKVLVVDDSADDRFILQHTLSTVGLLVDVLYEARDGDEAIEFLRQAAASKDLSAFPTPDLVLLDLKMPGRNGFDVLRWLREHSPAEPIQVVVLSGSDHERDVRLARELGAVAYLVKPATGEQLRQLIGSHFPEAAPSGTLDQGEGAGTSAEKLKVEGWVAGSALQKPVSARISPH